MGYKVNVSAPLRLDWDAKVSFFFLFSEGYFWKYKVDYSFIRRSFGNIKTTLFLEESYTNKLTLTLVGKGLNILVLVM